MRDLYTEQRTSLNRLIKVAKSRTGQSQAIANFLLAWWNAETCGGFDLAELRSVDSDYVNDMVNVIRYIASERAYTDDLGLDEELDALVKQWRPNLAVQTE